MRLKGVGRLGWMEGWSGADGGGVEVGRDVDGLGDDQEGLTRGLNAAESIVALPAPSGRAAYMFSRNKEHDPVRR